MPAGFIANLTYDSLQRLRELVKKTHMKHYPARHMNNEQADMIIEAMGPEILERQMKQATDKGLVAPKIMVPASAYHKAKTDKAAKKAKRNIAKVQA